MTTQTAPDTDSVDLAEFRSTVRAFANAEIHPGAAARDESKEFPAQLVKRLGQQDLMGISVPEEFGGLGLSTRTQLVAIEEVARTDAALASIYTAHYLGLEPILVGGSEEQKHRWLPQLASGELLAGFALTEPDAGSDIASMRTVARREDDGWHLSGSKTYISNAKEADLVVLFAKTDPSAGFRGITAFVVPKGTPGISYSEPQDKMGIRSAPDVHRLPRRRRSAARLRDRHRRSRRQHCLDRPEPSTHRRSGNGKRHRFARLGTGTRVRNGAKAVRHADLRLPGNPATPRWLRRATCRITRHRRLGRDVKDAGQDIRRAASISKYVATEACFSIVDQTVQIHGGAGFMRESEIERLYRDCRILRIFEGTSQIQLLTIAGNAPSPRSTEF